MEATNDPNRLYWALELTVSTSQNREYRCGALILVGVKDPCDSMPDACAWEIFAERHGGTDFHAVNFMRGAFGLWIG
jgi:hypothetical protein